MGKQIEIGSKSEYYPGIFAIEMTGGIGYRSCALIDNDDSCK